MPSFRLLPVEASTNAVRVDTLFVVMLILSALIILGIGAVMIYSVVRYRRRSEDEIPEQIEGSDRLELIWTLVPIGLSLIVFFWGARVYLQSYDAPANAMQIYVVGKQWMWKAEHPGGQEEINELHVPLNQPVKLIMTSQDVIHDFYVPAFRTKQDVIPGRFTSMWFQATQTGEFSLFCSQYCGTNHSEMVGKVIVMTPQDFQAWLGGGTTASQSPATAGQALFQQLGCSGCHNPNGQGPGPSLVGVYGSQVQLSNGQTVTADDNYIRESVLQPEAKIVKGFQPIMPSFQGRVNDQQLLQLIAYIRSLGSQQPGGGAAGQPTTSPNMIPGATPGVVVTLTPVPASSSGATRTP